MPIVHKGRNGRNGQQVHYKAPRKVFFVEQLPSNALGKVQKAKLRAALCAE